MINRKALIGQLTHTINMMKSHDTMTIACDGHFIKILEMARDCLKKDEPQEIDIEGGGTTWWFVCPECHGAIDRRDHYCKNCGQAVIYMGGKTEKREGTK